MAKKLASWSQWVLVLFLVCLIKETSHAEPAACEIQRGTVVHLVGETHGTVASQDLQQTLIPASLNGQIALGLEIDKQTLSETLDPQFKQSLFALEQPFSKGYGLTLWAWRMATWPRIKVEVGFTDQLPADDIRSAMTSFTYFLGRFSEMQAAVTLAKSKWQQLPPNQRADLHPLFVRLDQIIANPLPIDASETLLPVDDLVSLRSLGKLLGMILFAYSDQVLAQEEITEAYALKYQLESVKALTPIQGFDRADPQFGRKIYSYDRGYRTAESRLLFDWRSAVMAENLLLKICERQALGLSQVEYVVLVGAGHLSGMESVLKKRDRERLRLPVSVPPANHSDFDALLKRIKTHPGLKLFDWDKLSPFLNKAS